MLFIYPPVTHFLIKMSYYTITLCSLMSEHQQHRPRDPVENGAAVCQMKEKKFFCFSTIKQKYHFLLF